MNTKKHKLLFVLISLVIVAGSATAVAIAQGNASEGASSSRAGRTPNDNGSNKPAQASATTEGTFECLKHKGGGPQTLECGMGVRTDDGKMYGLRTDDPAALSSVPMGKRVRVTGTITEEATQYDTAGTIRVEKFEQL